MPWCPGCSLESNAKRKTCPECGQVLIKGPGLNQPVEFMDREWYSIRAVADPNLAERLRDFLETNGYEVAIRNGNSKPKIKNGKIGKAASMQILVPAEHAATAARFIRNNSGWIHEDAPLLGIADLEHDLVPEYEDDCFYEDEVSLYDSKIRFGMREGHDDFS